MSMTGELCRVSPARLQEMLGNPDLIQEDVLRDDLAAQDPNRCCTVEKTWNAIEFILDRLIEAGRIPWINPLTGGEETGAVLHYGPVWYRTAEEVQELGTILGTITKEEFRSGYLPDVMLELGVYPEIWDRDPEEQFDYVWDWYEPMVEFYRQAANAGDAVLVHLG